MSWLINRNNPRRISDVNTIQESALEVASVADDKIANVDEKSRSRRGASLGPVPHSDYESDAPTRQVQLPQDDRHTNTGINRNNGLSSGATRYSVLAGQPSKLDLLGLHLVHEPLEHHGDIILVHGLGGGALSTWSWKRKTKNFWPKWLAEEESLEHFRIFTFGYNSNFKSASPNLNINDFAKSLLIRMLTKYGSTGNLDSPPSIGSRPIILIAHSLGGLVVKKALILGKWDQKYTSLVSNIIGIMFLGTPHRGASNTTLLNKALSVAPLGIPPKAYVADLNPNSTVLQDMNEQFANVCHDILLASFFETLRSSFGIHKSMIVEKSSAVLGYPQEISDGLHGDHHSICKYRDRQDSNYINVRNVLQAWAIAASSRRFYCADEKRKTSNIETWKRIQTVMDVRYRAEDDLKAKTRAIQDGTCSWLIETIEFDCWLKSHESTGRASIFHLIGQPAAGKSSLASYAISHLQTKGHACQFHFFSVGDQDKRSVTCCLRSIVIQLAKFDEKFRSRLCEFYNESMTHSDPQDMTFEFIWDMIMEGIIYKMQFERPLIWIFDGVDEAETPLILINHILKIRSCTPIYILLASRPLKIPSGGREGTATISLHLTERHTFNDIRLYVDRAVSDFLPDDNDLKQNLINQIMMKAQGSFLWVKLVLEALRVNWHTTEDIDKSLVEVPAGMEPLYGRMIENLNAQAERQKWIGKLILTWAASAWRPLTLKELQSALEPKVKGFVKLHETINQVCGSFVVVEDGAVTLVHATARQFLLHQRSRILPVIDEECAHEYAALTCLQYLSSDKWRRVFNLTQEMHQPTDHLSTDLLLLAQHDDYFLCYATQHWAYHVSKARIESETLILALQKFLKQHCLTWIEAIALSRDVRHLTRSAKFLRFLAQKAVEASKESISSSPGLLIDELQCWATDFTRVVSNLGRNLLQRPSSVHTLLPPFCPQNSMISRCYANLHKSPFSVHGPRRDEWDDCIARVTPAKDRSIVHVLATNSSLITVNGGAQGSITIFSAETFDYLRAFDHGEPVLRAVLHRSSTYLATVGPDTFKVWDIVSGEATFSMTKKSSALPVAVAFETSVCKLVVGFDDCSVISYDLQTFEECWQFLPPKDCEETQACPTLMAISPDLSKVALAWRGKMPLIFDMGKSNAPVSRCKTLNANLALCGAKQIHWQQDSSSLVVLCENMQLILCDFLDDVATINEHIRAHKAAVSQDGRLLLTCDSTGAASVWIFPQLRLLYQLENKSELVRNICFSPDSQRFYKVTGNTCTVVEPDCLVQLAGEDRREGSTAYRNSDVKPPVIVQEEEEQSSVTSVASDSRGEFFCAGKDDGTVRIYDVQHGKKVCTVCRHSNTTSIVALHWSPSSRYVISGDNAGRVMVKRLLYRGNGKFSVFGMFETRLQVAIRQLLTSNDERYLLISGHLIDQVWNIESKEKACTQNWEERQYGHWIEHPFAPSQLIRIEFPRLRFFDWATLEETLSSRKGKRLEPEAYHTSHTFWAALINNHKAIVCLSKCPTSGFRIANGLFLQFLCTNSFQALQFDALTETFVRIIASRIRRVIGVYQGHLVFLDSEDWLCTWSIDLKGREVRHFFLPKEWVKPDAMAKTILNAHGMLLVPRHPEVAIVQGGIKLP